MTAWSEGRREGGGRTDEKDKVKEGCRKGERVSD